MLDRVEIKQVVDELIAKDNIGSVIISSKDGQPLYGLNKDGAGFGEELFTIPVAIISAMQMSSAFMSSLKDEVHEYIIFQDNRIVISIRKREIVLTVFVNIPQSSFERRIEVKQYAEMFKGYADKIDAIITLSGSNERGLSTRRIISESTGARFSCPPHTSIPLVLGAISNISSALKFTLQRTSNVSAVPEGDVIARDDVFGIRSPAAAIIGTIRSETLLPAIPPMECLS